RPKAMISIKPDKPVYRGENVTLRCEIQRGGDTEWTYSWYKDNKSLYPEGEGRVYTDSTNKEISIISFRDSDSGVYTCRGQRRDSQSSEMSDAVTLTVSGSGPSNPTVVAVGLGVAFLFVILLIIIFLLRRHRINKGKQQKTNQTSEQNQSRPGAEGAQSGPLEAGEAAAESSEVTYAPVTTEPKANRTNDADAEPSGSDVTYAELEMKPKKTAKGKTETASVDADTVYSEVKLNTE
ncbi:Fc receptor-like protein 5, partial [Clarias magur]